MARTDQDAVGEKCIKNDHGDLAFDDCKEGITKLLQSIESAGSAIINSREKSKNRKMTNQQKLIPAKYLNFPYPRKLVPVKMNYLQVCLYLLYLYSFTILGFRSFNCHVESNKEYLSTY